MRMQLTTDAVVNALAESLAQAWGTRAGTATVSRQPELGPGDGWLASWTMTGPIAGSAVLWCDRASIVECAKAARRQEDTPADADVEAFLREVLADAFAAFGARAPFTGTEAGGLTVAAGTAPAGAVAFDLTAADMPAWKVAFKAEVTATAADAAPARDERLSAVLEVELPLVVRFGRAVMPFRALAGLGPGSVVDMGRSPEEPVELLVGDRLIARGEVVIVGGNYGVRITELTGARHVAAGLTARAS
jgi:flagellar motor switch protein FliN/FliY